MFKNYTVLKKRPKGKDEIPDHKLLPHFLKLVLQTQIENSSAVKEAKKLVEAQNTSSHDEIEDEEEDVELETDMIETNSVTENEPQESIAKFDTHKLDLNLHAQYYLVKEVGRRGGAEAPGSEVTEKIHRRWSRAIWRKELDNLEPEYRLPTLILKRFKYIRSEEPTCLGPGTYDDNYYEIQKEKKARTTRGVLNACGPRFPKEKILSDTPGPGFYGDPYLTQEKGIERTRTQSSLPLFLSGPCNPRSVMTVTSSYPGPGHYNLKSSIDELLQKRVSLRGPYDLTTPPRDMFGLKTGSSGSLGPGEYELRLPLTQELTNIYNHYKGKFPSSQRVRNVTGERVTLVAPLWPRDNKFPGPADYIVGDGRNNGLNSAPFNSSAPARPPITISLDMSPDKYRPEISLGYLTILGRGWKSTFSSKTGRTTDDPSKVSLLNERMRGINIPAHKREYYDPNIPPGRCSLNFYNKVI